MADNFAYRFVVAEDVGGQLCLELVPAGTDDLRVLRRGTIGLDLRLGVTRSQAEDMARLLNESVTGITYVEDWQVGSETRP
jgi:hypothetical protein